MKPTTESVHTAVESLHAVHKVAVETFFRGIAYKNLYVFKFVFRSNLVSKSASTRTRSFTRSSSARRSGERAPLDENRRLRARDAVERPAQVG